jgi:hypothetical protein
MKGNARILFAGAIVLLAAGAAAAQLGTPTTTPLGRPFPGLGTPVPGPSTGTGGTVTSPVLTGQNGTTVPGITAPTPTPTTPPPGGSTIPSVPAIDQVVSITRTVEAGAPVSAFTVPAGQHLVITDVLITNPATVPICGAAVSPAGTPSTTGVIAPAPTTGVVTTLAESGTGLLCVPAQTSLNLGLTTGLEFAPGQSVQLGNAAPAAATPGGPLHYHLRGFLMSASGV